MKNLYVVAAVCALTACNEEIDETPGGAEIQEALAADRARAPSSVSMTFETSGKTRVALSNGFRNNKKFSRDSRFDSMTQAFRFVPTAKTYNVSFVRVNESMDHRDFMAQGDYKYVGQEVAMQIAASSPDVLYRKRLSRVVAPTSRMGNALVVRVLPRMNFKTGTTSVTSDLSATATVPLYEGDHVAVIRPKE